MSNYLNVLFELMISDKCWSVSAWKNYFLQFPQSLGLSIKSKENFGNALDLLLQARNSIIFNEVEFLMVEMTFVHLFPQSIYLCLSVNFVVYLSLFFSTTLKFLNDTFFPMISFNRFQNLKTWESKYILIFFSCLNNGSNVYSSFSISLLKHSTLKTVLWSNKCSPAESL